MVSPIPIHVRKKPALKKNKINKSMRNDAPRERAQREETKQKRTGTSPSLMWHYSQQPAVESALASAPVGT